MRRFYTTTLMFLCFTANYGQVGIATTTPQAMFDVASTDQGVLLSRVALTSRNVALPVINPQGGSLAEGTLVYNTSTNGTAPFNVSPGFYFWDNSNGLL